MYRCIHLYICTNYIYVYKCIYIHTTFQRFSLLPSRHHVRKNLLIYGTLYEAVHIYIYIYAATSKSLNRWSNGQHQSAG